MRAAVLAATLGLGACSDTWTSHAGTNCHRGHGGLPVGDHKDPIKHHLLQKECREACEKQDGCEGFVMHNTKDGHRANCWLRTSVDIKKCQKNKAFDSWLMPKHAGQEEHDGPHQWASHAGVNCHPGAGAALINGTDVLKGHKSLSQCQDACIEDPKCEAIIRHDTKDGHRDNCYLRTKIDLDKCSETKSFNTMVIDRDFKNKGKGKSKQNTTEDDKDGKAKDDGAKKDAVKDDAKKDDAKKDDAKKKAKDAKDNAKDGSKSTDAEEKFDVSMPDLSGRTAFSGFGSTLVGAALAAVATGAFVLARRMRAARVLDVDNELGLQSLAAAE